MAWMLDTMQLLAADDGNEGWNGMLTLLPLCSE